MNVRQASDYDDFFIATKKEAEKQVEVANEIVSLVEKYLKEIID